MKEWMGWIVAAQLAVLLLGMLGGLVLYTAIDHKLNWAAFGNQYERNQREMAQVVNDLIKQTNELKQQQPQKKP